MDDLHWDGPPRRRDDIDMVVAIGPSSDGSGTDFTDPSGNVYLGKPSIVGKHSAGDRLYAGFLSPESRREPVVIHGWDNQVKRLPQEWMLPNVASTGIWLQPEAMSGLAWGPYNGQDLGSLWSLADRTEVATSLIYGGGYPTPGIILFADAGGQSRLAWAHYTTVDGGGWLTVSVYNVHGAGLALANEVKIARYDPTGGAVVGSLGWATAEPYRWFFDYTGSRLVLLGPATHAEGVGDIWVMDTLGNPIKDSHNHVTPQNLRRMYQVALWRNVLLSGQWSPVYETKWSAHRLSGPIPDPAAWYDGSWPLARSSSDSVGDAHVFGDVRPRDIYANAWSFNPADVLGIASAHRLNLARCSPESAWQKRADRRPAVSSGGVVAHTIVGGPGLDLGQLQDRVLAGGPGAAVGMLAALSIFPAIEDVSQSITETLNRTVRRSLQFRRAIDGVLVGRNDIDLAASDWITVDGAAIASATSVMPSLPSYGYDAVSHYGGYATTSLAVVVNGSAGGYAPGGTFLAPDFNVWPDGAVPRPFPLSSKNDNTNLAARAFNGGSSGIAPAGCWITPPYDWFIEAIAMPRLYLRPLDLGGGESDSVIAHVEPTELGAAFLADPGAYPSGPGGPVYDATYYRVPHVDVAYRSLIRMYDASCNLIAERDISQVMAGDHFNAAYGNAAFDSTLAKEVLDNIWAVIPVGGVRPFIAIIRDMRVDLQHECRPVLHCVDLTTLADIGTPIEIGDTTPGDGSTPSWNEGSADGPPIPSTSYRQDNYAWKPEGKFQFLHDGEGALWIKVCCSDRIDGTEKYLVTKAVAGPNLSGPGIVINSTTTSYPGNTTKFPRDWSTLAFGDTATWWAETTSADQVFSST